MTSAAADWRRPYGAWLFVVIFCAAAILGFVGPLGLAALTALGGFMALPLAREHSAGRTGVILVTGLVLWAVISMAWSRATPNLAVTGLSGLEELTGVKLIGQSVLYCSLALAAVRLSPADAERALRWFAFALVGLAAVLILEALSGAQIYQAMEAMVGQPIRPDLARRNVAQGAYLIAVLVWPAVLLLRREQRNILVLALFGGVIAIVVLFGADAPGAALATGFAAFAAALIWGRKAVLTLMGLAVAYLLAAPWVVLGAVSAGLFARLQAVLPPSWDQRLDIWAFAAARIVERPLQGWGLDASRTWPQVVPLHTHDAALQLWLELGVVGAALAAAVVGFLFWTIAKAQDGRGFMAAASATAIAYLTIGALSFGVWQEWWLAIGALGVCISLAALRAEALWRDEENRLGGSLNG